MKKMICTICLLLINGCSIFPPDYYLTESQKQRLRTAPINVERNSTDEMKSHISKRQIIIGMNTDEVLVSWGFPQDINKSVGSWGVHEQWVYRTYDYIVRGYFYFENGILTSWQD